jgi:hypothetical protein
MFESCYTNAKLQPVPYSTARLDVIDSISKYMYMARTDKELKKI